MLLGERLKKLREKAGMTQQQLAEMVNLSQQTIGHYEVDRSEPSIKTLEMFAKIFNTSADYLLGLTDKSHSVNQTNKSLDTNLSDLPNEAQKEIESFIEFVKQKYQK